MEKTTIYVDPGVKRELEALSRRTGRSQAVLIREALAAYVDANRRPALPSFVASASVGGDAVADVAGRRAGGRT